MIQMVIHFARIAASRQRLNRRIGAPSVSPCGCFGRAQSAMPTTGAKMPDTTQDASSASATTAKSENVYSPASLRAKPTGTNPAMVTSVPVSRGIAVEA